MQPAVLVALGAVLVRGVTAQDELRVAITGSARTLDDRPWRGARVTLVASPVSGMIDSGTPDVVRVTTGDDGKFAAKLLRRREYLAWAVSPAADEDGRFRVSQVFDPIVPGVVVELREARRPAVAQPVEFDGLEVWKDHAPLRARVIIGESNRHVVQLDWQGGRVTMPPIPGDSFQLEVVGRDCPLIYAKTFRPPTKPGRPATRIELPDRRTVRVVVRDAESGKGIAGAVLYRQLDSRLVRRGVTGEDGVAEIAKIGPYSFSAYARAMDLFADAPGHAPGQISGGRSGPARDGKWKSKGRVHGHALLDKVRPFRGRILLSKDVPAANMTLIWSGRAPYYSGNGYSGDVRFERVLRTDAEGRFEIEVDDLGSYNKGRLSAVLSDDHIEKLPKVWRARVPARIDDLVNLGSWKGGDIRLDGMCPIGLEIVSKDGKPVPWARVALRGLPCEGVERKLTPVFASREGRATWFVRPGKTYVATVANDRTVAVLAVVGHRAEGEHGIVKKRITLRDPIKIAGSVTSRNGKPVPNLRLSCFEGFEFVEGVGYGADKAIERMAKGSENAALVQDLFPDLAIGFVSQNRPETMRAVTDENGEFELYVPDIPGKYTLIGRRRSLLSGGLVEHEFEVKGKAITDLRLTLK